MSSISQAQTTGANRRQIWIAAALGLLAAILVIVFLNNADGDGGGSVAGLETESVLVAAQRIPAGTKITEEMVSTRELAVNAIPADTFRDRALAVGQVARYPIERGEPLSTSRLVDAPQAKALSFQIPKGMRGMTIPVSIDKTPAALIAPGDFVDVIVTVEATVLTGSVAPANSNNREFKGAATLLQNVQVLSVDRRYVDNGVVYEPSVRGTPPDEGDKVSFVTLAVTPDEAQLLWLAQQEGDLTLVLRAFGDDTIEPLEPKVEPLVLP